MEPIKPEEVLKNRINYIHKDIIKVVNEILSKNFTGTSLVILQEDIVNEFLRINPDYTSRKLLEEKHLDFEDVYRKAGWIVDYDKPAYNDTYYKATFTFSIKK